MSNARDLLRPENWSWMPHVFSIEIKKAISYRVTFWIQFVISTATEIGVAYFLWKAIFAYNQTETLQGYTLDGMIYYYLFAIFALRIGRGSEHGYLSQDIYDGGLTRYLVYPLPFLAFKYVSHLAQQTLATMQFFLALIALHLLIEAPLTPTTIMSGLFTCLLVGYLQFVIVSCLEMVAFWQDVIWNLVAMYRFISSLLGGAAIPLTFFPEWGQTIVQLTPFPSLISFPTKTFLGQLTFNQWLLEATILIVWSLIFTSIASTIWNRGIKQYSGVGI